MERQGVLIRKLRQITRQADVFEIDLQTTMQRLGVRNSMELPRQQRSRITCNILSDFQSKNEGKPYQGEGVPTLGLWLSLNKYLGPDATSDAIRAGLISPDLFGARNARERSLTPIERAEIRATEFEQIAIDNGWRQE